MTTKIIMKSPCFFSVVRRLVSLLRQGFAGQAVVSPLRAGVCRPASVVSLLPAVLFLSASAWAGDLAVDNLTVTKDATIMGNMYFASTIGGTNAGGTASGGTITTNGDYRIHTFTNVGTANFVVSGGSLVCDVLVVAGGGGGGTQHGGGGGAGGLVYRSSFPVINSTYVVTIGAGGAGSPAGGNGNRPSGSNGGNSSFGTAPANIAIGGGGGGTYLYPGAYPGIGGSGGGGPSSYSILNLSGAAGTLGQGNSGGNGLGAPTFANGGGGGGAGSAGVSSDGTAAAGGAGLAYDISGTSVYYAGGGGAGSDSANPGGGAGGIGGGGAGKGATYNTGDGESGAANTGGGGGSGGAYTQKGGAGGSGIVIVRYSMTTSINITSLSISSNGISQTSASTTNVFMGKVGIGANNPAEKLHVVGNARVDGTNIVAAITLGNETRTNWPNVAVGALIASNNLADVVNTASARANLGLGTAATNDASAFDPAGAADAVNNTLSAHTANLNNPHQVTASQAGALSTTGGVVNGSLEITGSIAVGAPGGDIPMGVFINR